MAGSSPILIAQSSSVPLQWLDVLIVAVSVIGVTAFGMWIGRKEKSTGDYYLAGKTVAWWAVAGSIFGTNISSHHMVGMMGAGLKEGFAQANFEFGAIFGLLMLCYFFLPFYRRMGLYTLSEYLGRRFDERSRLVYSITNMAFLLIQMVATMILGALTIATLTAAWVMVGVYALAFHRSTTLRRLALWRWERPRLDRDMFEIASVGGPIALPFSWGFGRL